MKFIQKLFLQFNRSEYNDDQDVSAAAYKELNDYFIDYESDFTRSLELYNKSAEAYVTSMNDFFKSDNHTNETDQKHHLGAKRNAIVTFGDGVRCDDPKRQNIIQILKCDKIDKLIELDFIELKQINEKNQVGKSLPT